MRTLLAAIAVAVLCAIALAVGTWTTVTYWGLLAIAIVAGAVVAVQAARLVPQ